MKNVKAFTDGSCLRNPGPGGFGVILRYENQTKELSAGFPDTTNNAMELLGVINALACLKESCMVEVITDSKYVCDGVSKWLEKWKANNWQTKDNHDVKNKNLWQMLDQQLGRHQVTVTWIKGHNGHFENEQCDKMARECACRQKNIMSMEKVSN